jgi:hypothetical protein
MRWVGYSYSCHVRRQVWYLYVIPSMKIYFYGKFRKCVYHNSTTELLSDIWAVRTVAEWVMKTKFYNNLAKRRKLKIMPRASNTTTGGKTRITILVKLQ